MEIIVGTIILKDNKVLMVKETKKECYGKLAFPAGHLKDEENVLEGAKRELMEETGYTAELKKTFPLITFSGKRPMIMLHFLGDNEKLVKEYDKEEILGIEWVDIGNFEDLDKTQFRNYDVFKTIINSIQKDQTYNLDLIKFLKS